MAGNGRAAGSGKSGVIFTAIGFYITSQHVFPVLRSYVLGGGERGQQPGRQDGDNGKDHQEFDEYNGFLRGRRIGWKPAGPA